MSGLLPIGSVVIIKGSPSTLIIIGHGPISQESMVHYEYMATSYPFGLSNHAEALMFDRTAIENVLHTGYTDEKADVFYRVIDKLIRKE